MNAATERFANDFVGAIKEGDFEHQRTVATLYGARGDAPFLRGIRPPSQAELEEARARHASTPFIVTRAEDTHLVVVALPSGTRFVLRNLASLILTVDAATILATPEALA